MRSAQRANHPRHPHPPESHCWTYTRSREALCGNLVTAHRGGAGLTAGLMPQEGGGGAGEADDDPRVRTSAQASGLGGPVEGCVADELGLYSRDHSGKRGRHTMPHPHALTGPRPAPIVPCLASRPSRARPQKEQVQLPHASLGAPISHPCLDLPRGQEAQQHQQQL